ncbi:hypothetical protein GCM10017764_03750 [Sphingobacterium griseoflavum]|uniref:histidine kinase n=2 Tax=Sphingobacterium griseoflavum TaxID=1474952 RepID=A0ABQ3HTA2_9SPHI|nr:hypothetical protein GCM10017764_03750 [Sphingobacterium griseoflavum]
MWQKIGSIGVRTDMSYLDSRRLKMVNLITASAFVGSLCYGFGNLISNEHPILSMVDLIYSLGTLVVFRLHHVRRYAEAKAYLLIITSIFLITINFLSYNIAEYYLLCVLIVSILVFHRVWVQAVISVSLIAAILIPKFFSAYLPYSYAIGEDRLLINVPIAILFIFILVRHFKSIQQRYQEEIEKQQLHLEELNRDKEQLFAIVAHDIRSPLAATSQILQMLSQNGTDEAWEKKAIHQANAQLLMLTENVENLLHWSAKNLKGLIGRPLHFQVGSLLDQVLLGMQTHSLEKNIRLDTYGDLDLYILADPEHVRIILRNILSNAIKFSYENGMVDVRVAAADGMVHFAVTDHGLGMSEAKVEELFRHPLYPSYGTSGERGTGLGLILVHNLMEINGGNIRIESIPYAGTTIHLRFPKGEKPSNQKMQALPADRAP